MSNTTLQIGILALAALVFACGVPTREGSKTEGSADSACAAEAARDVVVEVLNEVLAESPDRALSTLVSRVERVRVTERSAQDEGFTSEILEIEVRVGDQVKTRRARALSGPLGEGAPLACVSLEPLDDAHAG